MSNTDQRHRWWDLHVVLCTDLAAVLAQPLIDDHTQQPTWPEDVGAIAERVLTLLDTQPATRDPGLTAALDGLQHLLRTLRERPAREWTPADGLGLRAAAHTCAVHTARVGEFASLWPHPPPPNT